MNKFAVFDFDGTLIRWQLYHSVFDKLRITGLIRQKDIDGVMEARHVWKTRQHEDAYKKYELVLVDAFKNALSKITYDQFLKIADEVYKEHKDQVYTYTRELIEELKEKDYLLFAISGSHMEIVERVAKHWGFTDWIASEYEVANNKFTGNEKLGFIDKNKSVEHFVKKYKLTKENSIGVGDSESDIAMLKLVENPIAFNPSKELYAHAKKSGWQIVVERKNVVYELSENNNQYNLA